MIDKVSFGQAYNFICSDAKQAQILQNKFISGYSEIRNGKDVFFIPENDYELYQELAGTLASTHNSENYSDVYKEKMRMFKFHAYENKIDMLA